MASLLVALFFSGAASLAYQVSWTRRLADVTSATTTAQAIVLAAIFAGMATGAVYPGGLAPRTPRPRAGYALVELGAALTALASLPAFSLFDRLRAAVAHAGVSPTSALAVELVVASLSLFVPAACMGASIPFVLAAAERSVKPAERTWFVAVAYGVNTLGAAVGCGLAGFVLVERVGLSRTTEAGALLSIAAAAVAVLGTGDRPLPGAQDGARAVDDGGAIPRPLLAAAALAGLVGVGAEVVWTRLFALVVLNTVYAFSQVLIAVLLGIVGGAWIARLVLRRAGDDARRIVRAAVVLQVGSALAMAAVGPACLLFAGKTDLQAAIAAGRSVVGAGAMLLIVALPAALNAATLPLLVGAVRATRISRSFGVLYSANTVGSVVGSLLAGFVLIPWLGTTGASVALEALSLVLAFGLAYRGAGLRKNEAFAVLLPAFAAAGLHLMFADVPRQIYESRLPEGTAIRELREGVASDVMVTESEAGQRRIWINSSWVAGTGGGHRALGHLPALFVAAPRRAVGIALGTGQTFAAARANGVRDFDVVEINPDVIRLSKTWFSDANQHLFERPGVHVHEEDGRAFLRASDERFDLVVLEPLQAWSAGTSSLYCREFYLEAKRVLARGGVVAQWIPLYGQGVDETRAMVRTAIDVFPDATLWLDEHDGILLLHDGPPALSRASLAERIAERGLGPELSKKSLGDASDLLSLVVLGPAGVQRWASGAAVLEDDRPFLEFVAARELLSGDPYPALLASITRARDPARPEVASILGDEVGALDIDVVSRAIVGEMQLPTADFERRAAALEGALAKVDSSDLLRARYHRVIEQWATSALSRAGSTEELEAVLRRAVTHDARYGEAMIKLAVVAARRHDADGARAWLGRAQACDETAPVAREMLRELR